MFYTIVFHILLLRLFCSGFISSGYLQKSKASLIVHSVPNYVQGDVICFKLPIHFYPEGTTILNDKGQNDTYIEDSVIYTLGVVTEGKSIIPLGLRENFMADTPNLELYYFEEIDTIPMNSVNLVNVVEDAYYTQRIIENRILNPHGEHAEDIWMINRNDLTSLPRLNFPLHKDL
jgi:hypothetical protein